MCLGHFIAFLTVVFAFFPALAWTVSCLCCHHTNISFTIVKKGFVAGLVCMFPLWWLLEYLNVPKMTECTDKGCMLASTQFSMFIELFSYCLWQWGLNISLWRKTDIALITACVVWVFPCYFFDQQLELEVSIL